MAGNRSDRGQRSTLATQRHNATHRPVPQGSDRPPNPPGRRQGGGNNRRDDKPSPWIQHPFDENPDPDPTASFVEYLRWMRSFQPETSNKSKTENNGSKLELLEILEEDSDYCKRLETLTHRTIQIANSKVGICFEAVTTWRIRVGGTRGPESMLLPAFDALGMPYIPSSTLKGVTRAMAIRDVRDGRYTESHIRDIFGDVNPEVSMGKIAFLDAYPKPEPKKDRRGGLTSDMANAIWKWDGDTPPEYNTNPNIFLSLKKSTFVIGLYAISPNVSPELLSKIKQELNDENATVLDQVRRWLVNGLAQGIGAQVNTGYGGLEVDTLKPVKKSIILKVDFTIQGQLIHGSQRFNKWELNRQGNNWKPPGEAIQEVRPTAFRSMLRYWFRALALGVLSSSQVRSLEKEIFGGIEPAPSSTGLFRVEVQEKRNQDDDKQEGRLVLRNSFLTKYLEEHQKSTLPDILKSLTWIMFHIGGIGQGARRPYYNRSSAPQNRGTTLLPSRTEDFWALPNTLNEFQLLFQDHLNKFYTALGRFSEQAINWNNLRTVSETNSHNWVEAVDNHCRIFVVPEQGSISRQGGARKPYALSVLHQQFHNLSNVNAKSLCGGVNEDTYTVGARTFTRKSKPSPIWIADLGDYQVVTAFGATQNPRATYLATLQNAVQIFPLSE